MVEQTVGFFTSFFANPSAPGIGLAIAFGAIWLVAYRSPLRSRPWLWVIIAISIFLTLAAVSFIQVPLQILAGQAMGNFWSEEVIMSRILLFGIPQILLSGLVQEGAKLVPIVLYWRREGRKLDPKMGLMVGAVAGAGFGAFEAQWVHNAVFASGWSWEAAQTGGLMALVPFGERFFVIAAHTAFSALAGYGLAKGKGWQFYLIASGLHALLNYSVVLLVGGIITGIVQLEIYVIAYALSATGWALWLRWRKTVVATEPEA
jgi:RsiW-degrading membrane proteinase PrsW (M82 family)